MSEGVFSVPDQDVVLCGSVSLMRNVGGIPFPPLMNDEERRGLLKEVHALLCARNAPQAEKFRFIAVDGIGETEAVSYVEQGLADASFLSEREGRGLFISEDGSCGVMVNGENHVTIRTVKAGSDLPKAFACADRLETLLDKSMHFAFDPQLGYLTRNPAHLGTGMLVSFLLHLPALADSGAVARLSSNLIRIGFSLLSVREPAPEAGGAFYRLVNRMTMGLSEQDSVGNLGGIAKQIVAQEREARTEWLKQLSVRNAVKKAVSSLFAARSLPFWEFADRMSLVRLGVACGLFSGVGIDAVDSLIRRVMPATLFLSCGPESSPEQVLEARAVAVKKALFSLAQEGE